ncbi:MAG: nucleoside-diphosphate sugar epimerase [Bdellovibrionales bacterium RIFOXYB1_FULL_37_110]|nr:MAG: nucleoside-diphosphate sugar epimerase [Bdellovibrionales bacterium RIFOXYC1_FULL_37_79]OFZ58821.1 MAG: nucleoside-diphosphate sugar epimerase [Bdellovibrionales bacterium RIFOXYB1_FULL_37_110]OFZ64820.1 MAG: nucleoside-diphosphate sugar epimerase [Bdellovibrionales bacterium RIFOXYD1_FULL_36_51]
MKIVITGALGHIGSKLIRELPNRFINADIVLIDNFLVQRYCSLFQLPTNGRYKFHEADIFEADLVELFKDADVVIHLAAITNAADSFKNADEIEKVNFQGTCRVAKACVETKSKLIFLSTTSVYGTQLDKVAEDCSLDELKPQSPYADSKLRSEKMLSELKGLEFIICRFGTIFGISDGMRFHTAINRFCWQATMGIPLTVWKTALNQYRPYLDLEDAVDSICFIIKNQIFNREIYNVLTDNYMVSDIVGIIREIIPRTEINFVETQIMNQLSYFVLNDKFTNSGFQFKGNIKEQITKTIHLLKGANTSLLVN